MKNVLLSIDWDYFMPYIKNWNGSCIENNRSFIKQWYIKYFEGKMHGVDVIERFNVGRQLSYFWDLIYRHFKFTRDVKVIVSDSHKLSYDIAKKNSCSEVFLFDSHSDLGYGGLNSLKFEINCANWLGKLLSESVIDKAHIIYSPYTNENPEDFKDINSKFNVKYQETDELKSDININVVHICRSGAWTPPWLDGKFITFIKSFCHSFKIIECPKREWKPEKLNLASKIDLMF